MLKETKYSEQQFEASFGHIQTYQSYVTKIDDKLLPAVVIVFKNKLWAHVFVYFLQKLAKVDKYEASVYLEDTSREIFEKCK